VRHTIRKSMHQRREPRLMYERPAGGGGVFGGKGGGRAEEITNSAVYKSIQLAINCETVWTHPVFVGGKGGGENISSRVKDGGTVLANHHGGARNEFSGGSTDRRGR